MTSWHARWMLPNTPRWRPGSPDHPLPGSATPASTWRLPCPPDTRAPTPPPWAAAPAAPGHLHHTEVRVRATAATSEHRDRTDVGLPHRVRQVAESKTCNHLLPELRGVIRSPAGPWHASSLLGASGQASKLARGSLSRSEQAPRGDAPQLRQSRSVQREPPSRRATSPSAGCASGGSSRERGSATCPLIHLRSCRCDLSAEVQIHGSPEGCVQRPMASAGLGVKTRNRGRPTTAEFHYSQLWG